VIESRTKLLLREIKKDLIIIKPKINQLIKPSPYLSKLC